MSTDPRNPRELVIEQIRQLMLCKSGPKNSLDSVNDGVIYHVFSMVRAGESDRACARWLISNDHVEVSNVESLGKIVGKFRRRVAPLMIAIPAPGNGKAPTITAPVMPPQANTGPLDELDHIGQLCSRYRAIIDRELIEAENGGALNQTLSRHVQALNQLLKTRLKLEAEEDKRARSMARGLSSRDERRFEDLCGKLTDGGRVMLAATKTFLELAPGEAIELDLDGPILHQKSRSHE